jgi:hypothetical protein
MELGPGGALRSIRDLQLTGKWPFRKLENECSLPRYHCVHILYLLSVMLASWARSVSTLWVQSVFIEVYQVCGRFD